VELSEAIVGRRTVRKFKAEEVSSNHLEEILEAIRWTPSWANTQCWEVVVVKDAERRRALAETLPQSNPAMDAMTQAPIVLALCAKKGVSGFYKGGPSTDKGDWLMFDTGLAVQNICLRAHSLGLGTVIVGLFDAKRAGEVLRVPEDHSVVVLIPLGLPEKVPNAPRRKAISEFVRNETY
jgi:nitroreductase